VSGHWREEENRCAHVNFSANRSQRPAETPRQTDTTGFSASELESKILRTMVSFALISVVRISHMVTLPDQGVQPSTARESLSNARNFVSGLKNDVTS
jgi:hypothetical protein